MAGTSSLERAVAVVTGAASGIGRAVVTDLVQLGARVVGVDLDVTGLETTAAALSDPDLFVPLVADVAEESTAALAVRTAEERFGRLTVVVNNAAVSLPGDVDHTSLAAFDLSYAVNVRAPFQLIKHALPALRRAGGGSIVNVGSINSMTAERQLLAYCTTKGALLMLTKSVAVDHAIDNVRCNIVCPGYVDTPINRAHAERLGGADVVRRTLADRQPLARDGRAAEISAVVTFLAGSESSFITGAEVTVDGGLTAGL
ncbi:MAG: SDR family oxidoreductase [Nocardioides sp.]|uniref:SDR family NAD(P)-dependent oxidoreductase n=1 Tax=Nocardioides sp. TaxID=35761 RepID=UPI0039E71376